MVDSDSRLLPFTEKKVGGSRFKGFFRELIDQCMHKEVTHLSESSGCLQGIRQEFFKCAHIVLVASLVLLLEGFNLVCRRRVARQSG